MSTLGLLTGMREFLGFVVEMTWRGFGLLLDGLVSLSPLQAGLLLFVFLSLHVGMAKRMQGALNTTLDKDPDAEYLPLFLEARYSLPGMVVGTLAAVVMLPLKVIGAIISLFKKGEEKEKEEEKKPVLVPALGPSYLWSALIVVGMYVLAVGLEPVIRWQIDVPVHFPTWQYVIFGHRAELGPFLPLQTYPYVGAVVVTSFWVAIWWGVARVVRLVQWDSMGVNLIKSAEDEGVLASWREYFGVTNLAELDDSFVVWARWLPWVALPFVLMAFVGLGGDPYRVSTSAFGVAVVVWVSWALHLWLEGLYRPEEEEEAEEERREEATAAGWIDVLNDLRRVHRIGLPALKEPIRDVEALAFSRHRLEGSELISPLLGELLPEPHRLTVMQHNVISSLSRHSFVHLDVPGDRRTLNLGGREESHEEELRHRNQIVVAPEGAGKTALGMLAAVNTALIHTGSTLVLARDKESARRLGRTFEGIVEPSTLRWNLRIRQIGGELVEDLAQGILPDLLVCDLQELVTVLLEDVETYRPFFMNLGLIVIDDVETFCGPVEVHAQLAMRRLKLRLKSFQGGEVEGSDDEERGPIFLVLAGDTMDELPTWVRSLCGIDAVPRTFGSQGDAWRGELARQARRDVDAGGKKVGEEDERLKTRDGRVRKQLIYDLASFGRGEKRLSVVEIIEACEALAVPWHYRSCGDERRLLGRSVLPLKNEPQAYVDDPLRAAVVFLDGHATAVEREIRRLGRAGAEFTSRSVSLEAEEALEGEEGVKEGEEGSSEVETEEGGIDTGSMEPIALIAMVDADESRVLETVDATEGLSDLMERLPRPFLRPPSGYLIKRHLTSELVQHWTEVAELLEVFGNGIAGDLRDLVRQGAVLQDARRTLEPGKKNYEERVYLRGLEAEILGTEKGSAGANRRLPPPVEDVEVASRRNVSLRERTTLAELGKVDAESARHRFYRGRIFETVRGRHVVVGYAGQDAAKEGAFEVGDVIVEPFLGEEVSSPRRRVMMEFYEGEGFVPEPMYLGEYPFGVSLMPVTCRVEEIGVFRLEGTTGEVRQRIYRSEKERGEVVSLRTKALGIYPNVEGKTWRGGASRGGEEEGSVPVLRLMGARVVAAAMRLVTPLIYRGADGAVGIGLCVEDEEAALDDELGPMEGFYFYDLHGGGNGAAQAIQRDGIEPILNLVMHLLEQVEDPRRLLAKYDEWDGVMSEGARRLAREEALRWLGSRLRFAEESVEEDEEAFEVSR